MSEVRRRPRLRLGLLRPVFWVGIAVLLTPAALITLSRIFEPEPGPAVQLVAFTPLAMPLYAVALVLAVVYGLVHRARRQSLRTLVWPLALLCLGALVLHAAWFAPQVTGDEPRAADDAERVTVMTVNLLRGTGVPEQVMEQVREHGVDVLVAVEATQMSVEGLAAEGIDDVLPHHAGTPAPSWHTEGTMVYAREPLTDVTELDTDMGSLLVTAGDLEVMAVHPSAPVEADLWHSDHEVVREAVAEHGPDVVAGDFNATNDHRPLRLLRDAGYRDAVELTNGGFEPTWPTNVVINAATGFLGVVGLLGPVTQIDHVLVSEEYAVLETASRDLYPSDHRMVLATVAERDG